MNQAKFVQVMRKQVTYFIKRRLHRVITETATQQDFASLASLKSLVAEVDSMKEEMNSCFSPCRCCSWRCGNDGINQQLEEKFFAEKHQQLPFMSEWEQRNRTSCQAAPDTNVSLTSILVTMPAEVEDCSKHETTPILLEPRTIVKDKLPKCTQSQIAPNKRSQPIASAESCKQQHTNSTEV